MAHSSGKLTSMTRWFLAGLLYADGMPLKSVAVVMGLTYTGVHSHVQAAKGHMLGVTRRLQNGSLIGKGSKLELRAAYVDAGWLTEPSR